MDDPNDFEWGFPKAKNRASNGTLYDTPPRFWNTGFLGERLYNFQERNWW
jgi:hypothetical protein